MSYNGEIFKDRSFNTMSVITPIAPEHIRVFRTVWQSLAGTTPPIEIEPFKIYAGVGAPYTKQHGFDRRDYAWSQWSFEACAEYSLPLDPEFNILAIDKCNGHDALNPELKIEADILAYHYVVDPDKRDAYLARNPHQKDSMLDPQQQKFATSEYHTPGAYRQAARRMGAKTIITFSELTSNLAIEVNGANFVGEEFVRGPSMTVWAPAGREHAFYQMDIVFREDLAALLRDRGLLRQPHIN